MKSENNMSATISSSLDFINASSIPSFGFEMLCVSIVGTSPDIVNLKVFLTNACLTNIWLPIFSNFI